MRSLHAPLLVRHVSGSWPEVVHPTVRARLIAEGVNTLSEWRALGKRRFRVWGITRRMARELDAISAREWP